MWYRNHSILKRVIDRNRSIDDLHENLLFEIFDTGFAGIVKCRCNGELPLQLCVSRGIPRGTYYGFDEIISWVNSWVIRFHWNAQRNAMVLWYLMFRKIFNVYWCIGRNYCNGSNWQLWFFKDITLECWFEFGSIVQKLIFFLTENGFITFLLIISIHQPMTIIQK